MGGRGCGVWRGSVVVVVVGGGEVHAVMLYASTRSVTVRRIGRAVAARVRLVDRHVICWCQPYAAGELVAIGSVIDMVLS